MLLLQQINKLFCEVVIAPNYDEEAIVILQEKKNRIILVQNEVAHHKTSSYVLKRNLVQDRNNSTDNKQDLKTVTVTEPTEQEIQDLIFALKSVKHQI
jgi:phosphoribosylaminoimidazolecarboxamide formyltransferase/IMP cyclohydrolase